MKYCTYQISYILYTSNIVHIKYWTYQILCISNIVHIRYCTHQILHTSNIVHIKYCTHKILYISNISQALSNVQDNMFIIRQDGNRGSALSTVTRLRVGRPGSDSRQGKIFLFATKFRPALGPIQILIQWVLGREANRSPQSGSEVKNAWSYTFTRPYVCMA
jgi:hypothetical protein